MKLGPNRAIRLTALSPTLIRVQLIPLNGVPGALGPGTEAAQQAVPKPSKNARFMLKVWLP